MKMPLTKKELEALDHDGLVDAVVELAEVQGAAITAESIADQADADLIVLYLDAVAAADDKGGKAKPSAKELEVVTVKSLEFIKSVRFKDGKTKHFKLKGDVIPKSSVTVKVAKALKDDGHAIERDIVEVK